MKIHKINALRSAVIGGFFLATSLSPLAAQTTGIAITDPSLYGLTDRLTSLNVYGGYSVYDGQLYYWGGSGSGVQEYRIYDIAAGTLRSSIPVSGITMVSNMYGDPFGLYDSINGIFYVGTYSNSDSGLYSYNESTGVWNSLGVFESLFGAATYDGRVYASGLNAIWNGGFGQGNQIALFDLTGAGNHDVIIQADGNSAGVAVDHAGNVYYASYEFGGSGLYMWTAEQVASVMAENGHGGAGGGEDDIFLTYNDATLLTDLPGGAYGINVDAAGNIFVTVNGGVSGLLMWNESMGLGDGEHYELIADAGGSWGWFNHVEVEGDFLNGGTLWVSSGTGLAEITYLIPEPTTFAMVIMGGLLALYGNRRRKS